MFGISDFICWVAVIGLSAAFLLGLAAKWHWLEWLQVHSPNDFFNKMFSCKFCCTWWVSVVVSVILCIATGYWWLLFAPLCSTVISRELW